MSAGLLTLSGSAGAATTNGYGTFGALTGAANAYTGTMQLPGTGYPAATVTSDSRAGSVGVQTGSTVWLPVGSPPGARYGSSQGLGYLNLRPFSDDATHPSTTTYTFASPAPTGWSFTLGDIDADKVTVTATLADGSVAPVGALGFQGTFNYCDASPKPSTCAGVVAPFDIPTWDAGTGTLTGSGSDTFGASGWFVPTAPLRSLTIRFTWVTGAPVYQTWFATRSQSVAGHVTTTGACDVTATTVRLLDAAGGLLASTHPAADGSYTFANVAATDTFSVALADVPTGCAVDGPASRALDLRTGDGTADFAVRRVPAATGTLSGTVTDRSGDPVADAVVVVRDQAGAVVARDATGRGGRFTLPALPVGSLTATVRPPSGYVVVGAATRPLVVPAGGGPLALDITLRRRAATTAVPAISTSPTAVLPEVGGVPAPLPWLGVLLLVLGGRLASVPRRRRH